MPPGGCPDSVAHGRHGWERCRGLVGDVHPGAEGGTRRATGDGSDGLQPALDGGVEPLEQVFERAVAAAAGGTGAAALGELLGRRGTGGDLGLDGVGVDHVAVADEHQAVTTRVGTPRWARPSTASTGTSTVTGRRWRIPLTEPRGPVAVSSRRAHERRRKDAASSRPARASTASCSWISQPAPAPSTTARLVPRSVVRHRATRPSRRLAREVAVADPLRSGVAMLMSGVHPT